VEGCCAELRGLKRFYQRYKVCEFHAKNGSIVRDGRRVRFCQKWGRFHPLGEFTDNRKCAACP